MKRLFLVLGVFFLIGSLGALENGGVANLEGLQGSLVGSDGHSIPDQALDKDYLFIYYGAQWCPNCKEFSPILKDFYRIYKKKYNDFELIFWGHSADASGAEAQEYAQVEGYRFPILDYEKRSKTQVSMEELSNSLGVPSMVLLNLRTGEKLSDTFKDSSGSMESYDRLEPFRYYIEEIRKEKNSSFLRYVS